MLKYYTELDSPNNYILPLVKENFEHTKKYKIDNF